jgi:hypothetical protein
MEKTRHTFSGNCADEGNGCKSEIFRLSAALASYSKISQSLPQEQGAGLSFWFFRWLI